MSVYNGFKIVPKIAINNKDTLALVYTPGVGSSCLQIFKTPEAGTIYTNKINSVAVIAKDYNKALTRALFLKSTLLIDAYPFVIKDCDLEELKYAIENICINFCAIDLSLMSDIVSGINFETDIPILKGTTNDLKSFFGAIARNVFMLDTTKLQGNIQERSLQLHELAGGVIETELTKEHQGKPIAIVSDGSAVLGFGDIGALASLPVMEGKSALYAEMANVNAVPFCIKTQKPQEVIRIVELFSESFAGIHLEDICAPNCFEIEDKLTNILNIPVMHDDQHCTAIIVLAGILNSLTLVQKQIENIKIVISGAGAAGSAIAKLLLFAGAKNIILYDINGVVFKGRSTNDKYLEELASKTNPYNEQGELKDIIKNADIFIGVSKGGILTAEMIKNMEYQPIVFALANPEPEIMPNIAKEAGAYIVATGRSDFTNQINNVLAFPGIFKGLVDGKIKTITNDIKLEASIMIASIIEETELNTDNIIPQALDRILPIQMAEVIAQKYGNSN